MTGALKQFVRQLDGVRMKVTAQRLLEEFVASRPSESELEVAALYYAAWCHEHTHGRPQSAA
jgi:hypothetical protein